MKIDVETRGYMRPSKSLAIAGQSLIKFGKPIRQASAGATMDDKFIIE